MITKRERGKEFWLRLNQDYMVTQEDRKYANSKYDIEKYVRWLSGVREVIVHCTATDSKLWDNPLACVEYDRNPNHISKKGCPTCTYHYYIEQRGKVYQMVSNYITTWHTKGHNEVSLAVCINHGGEKADMIEEEQYNSLADTICYIFDFMDWSYTEKELRARLKFHRDYANKLCPGENLDKEQLIKDCLVRFGEWGDIV